MPLFTKAARSGKRGEAERKKRREGDSRQHIHIDAVLN